MCFSVFYFQKSRNSLRWAAVTTSVTTTACKHCGAPIEQPARRGRPREYCPDGDCQAAAKRERELRRATPGLEGALARVEDLYERMEKGLAAAIEPLAQVLAQELSPAGVEAKLSAIQAEAHTSVAIARAEREQALEQVRLAREAAEEARREAEDARRRMEEAYGERDTAFADAETAREQALAALREAASTERRARQEADQAVRRAEIAETAREQAVSVSDGVSVSVGVPFRVPFRDEVAKRARRLAGSST